MLSERVNVHTCKVKATFLAFENNNVVVYMTEKNRHPRKPYDSLLSKTIVSKR